MAHKTLAMVLAGGEGRRLAPLTHERAKPAVPFGGRYRIIDFVLSNFANSDILRIKVLTQYKSDSLNTHISRGWRLSSMLGQFVEPVPAQMRTGPEWYKGSADAIYQNLNLVTDEDPEYVFVFGADHDFGKSIISEMFHKTKVSVYDFAKNDVPGQSEREAGYWRDVGDLDTYFESNMELVDVDPKFSLYNDLWPIHTAPNHSVAAAKFVFANVGEQRVGAATG